MDQPSLSWIPNLLGAADVLRDLYVRGKYRDLTTRSLGRAIVEVMNDATELFKSFSDDPGFRRWLTEAMFKITFRRPAG